jgi:RNA polymerase sigma factor (sigma-70 family)
MSMRLPPFQQLIDEHWRDVARLAAALTGPADAEDVAQQAWLQALRAYPSLRHGRNLKSWLLTITARAATDAHRQRARRPVPVPRLPDRPATTAEPSDHELWERVRALPDRQRSAVALHYVLDVPHTEIARVLGTTPAMSRRLVSDALATLRARIPEEARR